MVGWVSFSNQNHSNNQYIRSMQVLHDLLTAAAGAILCYLFQLLAARISRRRAATSKHEKVFPEDWVDDEEACAGDAAADDAAGILLREPGPEPEPTNCRSPSLPLRAPPRASTAGGFRCLLASVALLFCGVLLPLGLLLLLCSSAAPLEAPGAAPMVEVSEVEGCPRASNSSAPPTAAPVLFSVPLTRHRFPVTSVGNVVYYRSAYFGTVSVGMPAVDFKVIFDTGSGHLMLPSTYCQSKACRVHRRYRRSESRSAKDIDYDGSLVLPGDPRDQITVSFGTGEVTGVFAEDVVCTHEAANTSFDSQEFVEGSLPHGCVRMRVILATHMSDEPFQTFHFDGVLGLGLDGLSQAAEFNFLNVLAASPEAGGGGAAPIFSVFLAEEAAESKITFGGWDAGDVANEEDLAWTPVTEPEHGHWLVKIRSIRVDDEVISFCDEGCKGVVDTGTSLLSVPSAAFSEIYTLLRHPAHLEGHCLGPGPTLHLELESSMTISLGPEDYARFERMPPSQSSPQPTRWQGRPARWDAYCKPMLMAMSLPEPLGPKLFILGEPVLRKYLSVYDARQRRVGFAPVGHGRGRASRRSTAMELPPLRGRWPGARPLKSMLGVLQEIRRGQCLSLAAAGF